MAQQAGRSHSGPRKTAKANIRDVARLAGVSVATVSRVIGGTVPVSKDTAERVGKAMMQLDYVPNAHARALASPPSSVVLMTGSVPFGSYSILASGVERETREQGLDFQLVTNGDDWQHPDRVLERMLSLRAKVAVVAGGSSTMTQFDRKINDMLGQFESVGTAVAVVGRPRLDLDERINVVDYDNRDGMRQATRHLLELGHRRIAFAGRVPASATFEERYEGFREALAEAGVTHDEARDLPWADDREADAAAIKALLTRDPGITAVVCLTDTMAVSVMTGLRELGLSVPADVSVVGFDDIPFAADFAAPLTTVHVPFDGMGASVVSLALSQGQSDLIMDTELIVRGSTAAPRR